MSGLHTFCSLSNYLPAGTQGPPSHFCISQENWFNCRNTFFSYRRICHDQNTLARMLLLNHAAHKIKMGWRNSESSQKMVHFQEEDLRHKRRVSYVYSKAWGPVLRKFPPIFFLNYATVADAHVPWATKERHIIFQHSNVIEKTRRLFIIFFFLFFDPVVNVKTPGQKFQSISFLPVLS